MGEVGDERFRRGWERLMEVDAEGGAQVIESLQGVAPDLGRYVVEFAFGDIYSRPILDLRQRQLVTIAALTTMGGAERQLDVHVNAGLNVGLTAREIVEAMLHCVPYTGFPRVLNAVFVAKRVFEARNVSPLPDDGAAVGP
jgi:4-carboxymuconolactone decarboxylase